MQRKHQPELWISSIGTLDIVTSDTLLSVTQDLLMAIGQSGKRLECLRIRHLPVGITEFPHSDTLVSLKCLVFNPTAPIVCDLDDYVQPVPDVHLMKAISRVPNLHELSINNGVFPYERLSSSMVFKNLLKVDLESTMMEKGQLSQLSHSMPNLTELHARKLYFMDLKDLKYLPHLTSIWIGLLSNEMFDAPADIDPSSHVIHALHHCPHLRHIRFQMFFLSSSSDMVRLLNGLPLVDSLEFLPPSHPSLDLFTLLSEVSNRLRTLKIVDSDINLDKLQVGLSSGYSHLESLVLNRIVRIREFDQLKSILDDVTILPKLRYLSIDACEWSLGIDQRSFIYDPSTGRGCEEFRKPMDLTPPSRPN